MHETLHDDPRPATILENALSDLSTRQELLFHRLRELSDRLKPVLSAPLEPVDGRGEDGKPSTEAERSPIVTKVVFATRRVREMADVVEQLLNGLEV